MYERIRGEKKKKRRGMCEKKSSSGVHYKNMCYVSEKYLWHRLFVAGSAFRCRCFVPGRWG